MNIGVLGSGFIVSVFVKNAKMYKQMHLRAIWGRHEEKIKQFIDFDYYTCDINKILNDPKIDVIYVALPNNLHYEYAYKALKANKHVILEKPFCTNYNDAIKLCNYAKKKKLLLYEAIMTIHSPTYLKIKQNISKLGNIKIVEGNFSQYSRKYDKFKNNIILPAFDYKLAGGSLMDLGIYNIHYVTGLFGKPKKVVYYPNVVKRIDTSGILMLDYGFFKASMVNAKDCKADAHITIQGDKGFIRCNTTPSQCANITIKLNNKNEIVYGEKADEFVAWKYLYRDFINIYRKKDYDKCYKLLEQSLLAMKVLDEARKFII